MHKALVSILLTGLLTGCATHFEPAKSLSAKGVETADHLVSGGTQLQGDWENTRYLLEVNRYLARASTSAERVSDDEITAPAAKQDAAQEQRLLVSKLLAKRIQVFRALARLYDDFDSLTHFDAADEFTYSYLSLVEAVKAYGEVLEKVDFDKSSRAAEFLSEKSATRIAGGLALLQRRSHQKNIEQANAAVSEALGVVVDLYEMDIHYYRSIRRNAARGKLNLYRTLSSEGLIDESAAVSKKLAALVGAKPASNIKTVLKQKPRLKIALRGYTDLINQDQERAAVEADDAMLRALKRLQQAHQAFGTEGQGSALSALYTEIAVLSGSIMELREKLDRN
jgi:superfamily I DNA/RNA helicase